MSELYEQSELYLKAYKPRAGISSDHPDLKKATDEVSELRQLFLAESNLAAFNLCHRPAFATYLETTRGTVSPKKAAAFRALLKSAEKYTVVNHRLSATDYAALRTDEDLYLAAREFFSLAGPAFRIPSDRKPDFYLPSFDSEYRAIIDYVSGLTRATEYHSAISGIKPRDSVPTKTEILRRQRTEIPVIPKTLLDFAAAQHESNLRKLYA